MEEMINNLVENTLKKDNAKDILIEKISWYEMELKKNQDKIESALISLDILEKKIQDALSVSIPFSEVKEVRDILSGDRVVEDKSELEAELEEANENSEWWHSRFIGQQNANEILRKEIDSTTEYLTSYECINELQRNETPKDNEGYDIRTMEEMIRRYLIVQSNVL